MLVCVCVCVCVCACVCPAQQKIRELQEEIVQCGNKMKKMEEEMKFYKLELINREDNFNNKFGGGPTIGVMDPLSFGKKKVQIPKAQRLSPEPAAPTHRHPHKL
jgi:L-lactate utilization protein LutB